MGIAERYFGKDGEERTAKGEVDTDPETSAVGAAVRGFPHEFSLDAGHEPFRFVHFNLQAVLKGMAKDVV